MIFFYCRENLHPQYLIFVHIFFTCAASIQTLIKRYKNPFWFMFLKIGRFDLFLLFYIYRELFFNGRSRRQRSWRTTIPSCLRACFSFLLFRYFSFLYSETDLSFDKIFKYKWNYTKKTLNIFSKQRYT